jgi:hypothetical protein
MVGFKFQIPFFQAETTFEFNTRDSIKSDKNACTPSTEPLTIPRISECFAMLQGNHINFIEIIFILNPF